MRTKLLASILLTAGLLVGTASIAATGQDELLVATSERKIDEARVVSVDLATRSVVLQMPSGQMLEFANINPKVTRLNTLKPNDTVTVTGAETMAFVLQKGTAGIRKVIDTNTQDLSVDGAGMTLTHTVYNDIVGVNVAAGTLRVKDFAGKIITVPVANKEWLTQAAAGDQLLVVTRASMMAFAN
ncbi:hypothetical protein [Deefgea piscis]|uniref:hypothetical protein n=1 Tax=Deefgea piscis TaxID=2739061 RepID=UPI001C80D34A|nr:hypothetical protein [Deefgea piscis]QZA80906.1 hypothetical protein K4H25_15685 [Deefgea piscis]